MKHEQTHIDYINEAFGKMDSKEELLNLLNFTKPLTYNTKVAPFELKKLTWYANPKLNKERYKSFAIKKKSGESRIIHAPVNALKAIQKVLAFVLQSVFEPHEAAFGFVRGKSIVGNANVHAGSRYVYNIDLKDFFQSIDQARVWKCLQLKPFNLTDSQLVTQDGNVKKLKTGIRKFDTDFGECIYYKIQNSAITLIIDKKGNYKKYKERLTHHILKPATKAIGPDLIQSKILREYNAKVMNVIFEDAKKYIFSKENTKQLARILPSRQSLANIIASLCCTEMEVERKNEVGEWEKVKKNVLPQGAPTSPIITNIVCQRLDYLLSGVAKRFGLKYSRYADDITFSSMHNVYQPESDFLTELQRIILEQGFHIKESKTRLQKDGYRKEVTGLLVNEKANVQQRYIKQLRMWLYYWERYGYERAYGFFLQEYIADNGHIKKGRPDMANVIAGKMDYLKMVKGADNDLYRKLKNRFDVITGKNTSTIETIMTTVAESNLNSPMRKLILSPKNEHLPELQKQQEETVEKNTSEKSNIPIFHNPKKLVTLLKNFSVNDSALKYTTHSWDAGRDANMFKDLTEFLSIAKNQYNEFSFPLNSLSRNLHGKINSFLFNKDIAETGWGDPNPAKRIRFGWSSPELTEACFLDASLNPEDFILPIKYQIQRAGKTLQKFKHVIDVFKNEIEIRDENSALLNLILQKHDNYLMSFSDPLASNLENKTFYTDIQWLSKALDLIFEGIQKYPQHPEVEYYVEETENDRMILNILHRNSFKTGMSIHDDKLNLKRGDFSTIKDKLRNLCDWSIESQFAEGFYRINYLVSDKETQAHQKIETTPGFKHILTFYK